MRTKKSKLEKLSKRMQLVREDPSHSVRVAAQHYFKTRPLAITLHMSYLVEGYEFVMRATGCHVGVAGATLIAEQKAKGYAINC